jgi:hypothetical protein
MASEHTAHFGLYNRLIEQKSPSLVMCNKKLIILRKYGYWRSENWASGFELWERVLGDKRNRPVLIWLLLRLIMAETHYMII